MIYLLKHVFLYVALERSAALGNPMFMESLYWMYGPRRRISFGKTQSQTIQR